MVESPNIFPICRKPCLSNFSTILQKGADSINEVSRLINRNFTVTSGMHVQVSCRKNYTKTPGVSGYVSRKKSPNFVILLNRTLVGLIISKSTEKQIFSLKVHICLSVYKSCKIWRRS